MPIQPQPVQIIENLRGKYIAAPRMVDIVNPQDHFAARLPLPDHAPPWPHRHAQDVKGPVGLGANRVITGRSMAVILLFVLIQTYRFATISSMTIAGGKIERYCSLDDFDEVICQPIFLSIGRVIGRAIGRAIEWAIR